jgi:hypothetical protein
MSRRYVDITALVEALKNGLRDYVRENIEMVSLEHAQYHVEKVDEGYSITISITGHGVQHLEVRMPENEFSIRGGISEKANNSAFPFQILADFMTGIAQAWLSQQLLQPSNGSVKPLPRSGETTQPSPLLPEAPVAANPPPAA